VTWRPWKRYESSVQPIEVDLDEIEEAVVYARSGVPASCPLELLVSGGAIRNLTVFASADVVERAFSTA
jgi:hypothetical protein